MSWFGLGAERVEVAPIELQPGGAFQELYGPHSLSAMRGEYAACLTATLGAHEHLSQVQTSLSDGRWHDTYGNFVAERSKLLPGTIEALNRFRLKIVRDYYPDPAFSDLRDELRSAFRGASQAIAILEQRSSVGDWDGFKRRSSNSNPALLADAKANFELLIARLVVHEPLH